MRRWIGEKLRRWADRIDHKGAPKSVGLTFTFERGRGAVLHGEFGSTSTDRKGCLLWYLGDDEHEKAWTDSEDRPSRVLWENLAEGRRPFVDNGPACGCDLAAGKVCRTHMTMITDGSRRRSFATGGVVRPAGASGDDSVPFTLGGGHVPPAAVEFLGEDGARRLNEG